MVDENEIKGAAREFGGKVQDALDAMAADAKTQAEGKWNQAAGQTQRVFGCSINGVVKNVQERPLVALAIIAGIAFLAGTTLRK